MADAKLIRRAAMDLLARREFGINEMQARLRERFGPNPLIDDQVTQLVSDGLLSDQRFVEAFVRAQRHKGHGPLWVLAALQARGVDAAIIERGVMPQAQEWGELAASFRVRRFGEELPASAQEKQRQIRYLRNRGFNQPQISRAFRAAPED